MRKPKLSPSILSADFANLGCQLDILKQAGADAVHLDVMDGIFVPNISIGLPVIKSLRKHSDLIFDVHLMIENPKEYVERFAQAGADIITFHVESCDNAAEVFEVINLIKAAGKRAGLTLKPETPIESIYEFVPHLDRLLIMSVKPGYGGQKFMPDSLEKVRKLRNFAPNLEIEIDGGINADNVREVLAAGVNVVVVGNGIFRSEAADVYAATMEFVKLIEEY